MSKRAAALLLTLMMLFASMSGWAEDKPDLLVIRSRGEAGETQALAAVVRALTYQGRSFETADATEEIDASGYDGVIVCLKEGGVLGEAAAEALRSSKRVFVIGSAGASQLAEDAKQLEGMATVQCEFESGETQKYLARADAIRVIPGSEHLSGSIECGGVVYPLCAKRGNITHLAYFDAGTPFQRALLSTLLTDWLWPYANAPHRYGTYVVLDNVYPFEDLQALMALIDLMREEEIPYAICLMPIYDNGDYPSMKALYNVLRYAQSQGAFLVLRTPLVRLSEVEPEDMLERMDLAYEAYLQNGVYPLALEAPASYAFTEEGLKILRRSRTVLLFETDGDGLTTLPDHNLSYQDGLLLVAPAYSAEKSVTTAHAQAIYIDVHQDLEDVRAQIRVLKNSSVEIADLRTTDHSVYMSDSQIQMLGGRVFINGDWADLRYTPLASDEDYEYDKGVVRYFTDQIRSSNELLLIFVFITSLAFTVIIYLFRRQVRRQMLGKRQSRRREGM